MAGLLTARNWIALLAVAGSLAGSVCATAQSPTATEPFAGRTISTSLASFNVPFKINNPAGSYIEVQLYFSRDQGQSWSFYQRQDIGSGEFKFKSDGDGEYWFALKTLDRNRQLLPPGKIVQPELKIIIDTRKPLLDFRVQSDAAGRVVSSWKIIDENIDPGSLIIAYRDADSPDLPAAWKTVDFRTSANIVRNNWSDQVAWWPAMVVNQLEVRCQVSDRAGNQVSAVRSVVLNSLSLKRSDTNSTAGQGRTVAPSVTATAGQTGSWKPLRHAKQTQMRCENGVCTLPEDHQPTTGHKSQWNQATRVASSHPAGRQPFVGSQPEYVDPPAPDSEPVVQAAPRESAPRNLLAAKQASGPESISWASKSTRWSQREQISKAATRGQNQPPTHRSGEILVDAGKIKRRFQDLPVVNQRQDRERPPANQSVSDRATWQDGNMTVSESTTRGRGVPRTDATSFNNAAKRPVVESYRSGSENEHRNSPFVLPGQKLPGTNQGRIPTANHLASRRPRQNVNFEPDSSTPRLNVNSLRFNLNYDVRSIDPSGVGRVILWATEDGGQNWQSWAADPDNVSPFPVEVKNEGIYGFRVVINSRDGLTGKPPYSGDPPDVWVQVDTTRPDIALTSAPFGSGKDAGKLIIHWDASDRFLALRPIRLYYSPNPDGPWTTIESGLRNSGSFAWKVPKQVPQQIYLRIEAVDTADNVGAYQLTAPIDISGLVPRGKILGVEPIPDSARM